MRIIGILLLVVRPYVKTFGSFDHYSGIKKINGEQKPFIKIGYHSTLFLFLHPMHSPKRWASS